MLVWTQPKLIWKSPDLYYSILWISIGTTIPVYLGPDPWNLTEGETFQGSAITPMLLVYGELWAVTAPYADIHHQSPVQVLWLGDIPLRGQNEISSHRGGGSFVHAFQGLSAN